MTEKWWRWELRCYSSQLRIGFVRLQSRWKKILFPDTGILRSLCVSLKCFLFLCSSLWTGSCQTCCSCECVAVPLQCHVRHSHVIFVYIRKLGEIELAFRKQMPVLFMRFFPFMLFGEPFFLKLVLFYHSCNFISFQRFIVIFCHWMYWCLTQKEKKYWNCSEWDLISHFPLTNKYDRNLCGRQSRINFGIVF